MDNQKNMMFEVIDTLYDYLFKLIDGIKNAIGCFRNGQEQQGYELLTLIIEGLQWVLQAVAGTKEILILNDVSIDDEELAGIFQELFDAMKNHDSVLIADMLEYEILPMLEDWQSKIGKILTN